MTAATTERLKPGKARQSWFRFWMKGGLIIALIYGSGAAFATRYHFGIDSQHVKCIPGITFYLIDTKDHELVRDGIYSFSARGMEPVFPEGREVVKYLRGLPGDHVVINEQEQVLINDSEVAVGLKLAYLLNRDPSEFFGAGDLGPDNYWFMGISTMSYDSRYWGTVSEEQIIGRAYPLF